MDQTLVAKGRVLFDLQDALSRFAKVYSDLAIAIPDASRGNPVFVHSFFAQDAPEKCVSPDEWRKGFLSNLPVYEFPHQQAPPLLGFDASAVRFSADIEEHREMMMLMRRVHDHVLRKGLLVKDQQRGIEYLSSAFHFGAYSVWQSAVLPTGSTLSFVEFQMTIGGLFSIELEPGPSEAPSMPMSLPQTGDDSGVHDASRSDQPLKQRCYMQLKIRYGDDADHPWVEDTNKPEGVKFVVGPGTASFSARERFLLPLNLLMLKFIGAILDVSTPLLLSPAPSPPSSGNQRDKKMAKVKREGEHSDTDSIGSRLAVLKIEH